MRWKRARSSARSSVGPVFGESLPTYGQWRGRHYATKQVEAIAVEDGRGWLVVTVLVKYF